MIAHRSAHMRKKCAVEIGHPPFARAGIHVERKKCLPMGFGDAGACQKLDLDATGERRLAFAADHFSLSRRESGQKGVEIRVTLVDEMKLLSGALQEAGGAERLPFGAVGKSDVERRGSGFFAKCAKPGDKRLPRCFAVPWRDEQPAAGDRRERHRDLQLRIIGQSRAVIGIGPAMIEYVLAHGMGLQIGRRGGGETAAGVLDENMRAGPAGSRANRLRSLKSRQEGMGYKRVKPLPFICWLVSIARGLWSRRGYAKSIRVRLRIGANVPLRGVDLAHRLRDMDRVGRRHRGTPGRNRLLPYRDRWEQ